MIALLLAACVASYLGATGAVERFNTIPVRAASTGLLLISTGLLVIEIALSVVATF